MEEEVWGTGRLGAPSSKTARGGEPAAQAPGGGPDARQADVAGCPLKKILKPAQMRERVGHLEEAYWVSDRRACRIIGIYRSSHRYRSHHRDGRSLRKRIIEIAQTRVRYGYRRVYVLLRREGWRVNHNRTRIYCQEGLHLRRKRPRRHVSGSRRMVRPAIERPNACWSMDFVFDS